MYNQSYRLPILIAGDFNGSQRGSVFKLMREQNYRSAQQDLWELDEDVIHTTSIPQSVISSTVGKGQALMTASTGGGAGGGGAGTALLTASESVVSKRKWSKWVSHKSHRKTIIPVDHVFYRYISHHTHTI